MQKYYCSDCGRQLCENIFDSAIQAPLPITIGCCGNLICANCAKDYDQNGLLPGEDGYSR